MGFKWRILLPVILLLVAGFIITASVSYFSSSKALYNTAVSEMKGVAENTAALAAIWVNELRATEINNLASQEMYSMAFDSSFVGKAALKRSSQEIKRSKKTLSAFECINARYSGGAVLFSSGTLATAAKYPAKVNIKEIKRGKVLVSEPFISPASGIPLREVASGIYAPEGWRPGIMSGYALLSEFGSKYIYNKKIGKLGLLYLTDSTGRIILHPDNSKQLNSTAPFTALGGGSTGYTESGREKLAVVADVPGLSWKVVAEADLLEIMAPAHKIRFLIILIALISGGIIIAVILYTSGSVIKPLSGAVKDISSVTDQVHEASVSLSEISSTLAESFSTQASGLEHSASAAEELASTIKQSSENARASDKSANEAAELAENGMAAVEKLSDTINGISSSASETSKIIKTINEISFQTNLLALNAAVEAARAGAAGRGFAVVAEEVRNLAKRSSDAANLTQELIEKSLKNVQSGSKVALEVTETFRQIGAQVVKVRDLVKDTASAAAEQAKGIGQINASLSESEMLIQRNTQAADEASSHARALAELSESLKKVVETLQRTAG